MSGEPGPGSRAVTQVLATSTGGVGVHVRSVTAALIARGWTVRVLGPAATDELFGFAAAGAQFVAVQIGAPVPGPALLRAVRAVRAAVPAGAVVHAHGLRAAVVCVLARRRPLVATWHNLVLDPPDQAAAGAGRGGPRARIARRAAALAAALGERVAARGAAVGLGASQDLVDRIAALGGRDARLAPVAAPARRPERTRADVRARLATDIGLAPRELLAVTVARLHPQKGLDVLIAALAERARAAAPGSAPVRAVIAGDGPLERELAGRIDDAGAPVHLVGRRDDVPDLLAAADLVILPSRWEARSLVAQEALQAGRALIATAVGGLPELVGDGAVLVPPDDARALRAAIDELADSPARRAEVAARGAARAAAWPGEADTADQLEAIYLELAGRAGASDGA